MNRTKNFLKTSAVVFSGQMIIGVGAIQGQVSANDALQDSGDAGARFSQIISEPGNEKGAVLSPDGLTTAFVSDKDGSSSIYLRYSDGQISRVTSSLHNAGNPTWSPDGNRIAFYSDRSGYRGIWVLDVGEPDAAAEAITPTNMTAFHASWSPVGDRIAFISDSAGSYDVWTVALEGGHLVRVTDHPDNEWWPRWSPDGRDIVFYTTWGDAMTDIWTIGADGSNLNQITNNNAEDYRPTWSPDGSLIAFVSNRENQSDLWVVPAGGGAATRVTNDNSYRDFLSWSPDGDALIVSYQPNTSIYAISVTGDAPQQLTSDSGSEFGPSVSPTGRWLLYEARYQREENIWLLPLDDGNPRVLAGVNEFQTAGAWSPDGATIAFVQGLGGDPRSANLWTAPSEGGMPRKLTDVGYVSDPVWCEQGNSIVFSVREGEQGRTQLWKVPSTGGVAVVMTDLPDHNRPTDCSPDGSRILLTQSETGAYRGSPTGEGRILEISVFGGDPVVLRGDRPGEGGRWSPDGSTIAFVSNENGVPAIFIMPANGGRATAVTGGEGTQSWPSWSPDGKQLFAAMSNGGFDIWRIELQDLLQDLD